MIKANEMHTAYLLKVQKVKEVIGTAQINLEKQRWTSWKCASNAELIKYL